jgi:hypothetical protein
MWLTIVLFFLLSPGVLVTIPGNFSLLNEHTSIPSILIHTILFALVLVFCKYFLKGFRIEGFHDKTVEGWKLGDSCGTEYCMTPKEFCKENETGTKYCSETE